MSGITSWIPLIAYFGALGWALVRTSTKTGLRGCLQGFLALAVTWTFIFRFFIYGPEVENPLASQNLFIRAYEDVSNTPEGWFWSSILLMEVVPLIAVVGSFSEALRKNRLDVLALVVVGFMGAISAMMMFLLDHELYQRPTKPNRKQHVSWVTLLCSVAAFFSAIALPFTVFQNGSIFIVALSALHIVLVIPVLLNDAGPRTPISAQGFLNGCAVLCCLVYWFNLSWIFYHGGTWWTTLMAPFRNNCQVSISTDALVTAVAILWWSWRQQKSVKQAENISVVWKSVVFSPGALFSYMQASFPPPP
eukprot:gb/GECG01013247.1/.p1 GENE.gb/GECG01013247.1/~~gb/GECG01013247.1/.p1  ORF type:complete len:306 (+),score=9.10 gb/GECG01013247.1/:1-918(+)